MPRAVLLDALGTLLELEPPAPRLVGELAARGARVTEEEGWAALRAEIGFYRQHHDMASDREGLAVLRARCTEVLRAALPAHARDVPDLQDALLAALRFRAYPEVPEVLRALRAAGVPVTLGSDDPPYFATSIGHEYDLAHERLGADRQSLLNFTENALDAAFCDDQTVNDVRERLAAG